MASETTNLQRFVDAQEALYAQATVYATALAELRRGQKRTHWMWFTFPQIAGLGFSATSKRYAIRDREEARHYLRHPLLGKRLVECAEIVLGTTGRSAAQIFGAPDDIKLSSCMTLFAALPDADPVFARVLDKYFQGKRDARTLQLLGQGA